MPCACALRVTRSRELLLSAWSLWVQQCVFCLLFYETGEVTRGRESQPHGCSARP